MTIKQAYQELLNKIDKTIQLAKEINNTDLLRTSLNDFERISKHIENLNPITVKTIVNDKEILEYLEK